MPCLIFHDLNLLLHIHYILLMLSLKPLFIGSWRKLVIASVQTQRRSSVRAWVENHFLELQINLDSTWTLTHYIMCFVQGTPWLNDVCSCSPLRNCNLLLIDHHRWYDRNPTQTSTSTSLTAENAPIHKLNPNLYRERVRRGYLWPGEESIFSSKISFKTRSQSPPRRQSS